MSKHSTKNLKLHARERRMAISALVALIVVAGLALTLAAKVSTRYSISQFLPKAHPLLKEDLAARERFMLDESQPILITLRVSKGDWLETKRLARLEKVTNELSTFEGAKGALSLATIQSATHAGDLSVGNLLKIRSVTERRKRVKKDKFLTPMLISKDLHRTLIAVSFREDVPFDKTSEILASMKARLRAEIPEATITIGGVPAIQTQLSALVRSELVKFMGLALLACCASLLLMFSSKSSIMIPFVAIFVSNIFVLAFMSAAGISMSVLAVTIPIIVSVEVLSLCIHTMLRFVEDVEKTEAPFSLNWSQKAVYVWQAMRAILGSNFLTSTTTCAGFATLIAMQVPLIREFGIAVAASVLICWAVSMVVCTLLLLLLPIPTMRQWLASEASWADLVFKAAKPVVISVGIGAIVMAVVGQKLHWSARLFDDLPKKEEARRATETIDKSLGGTIPLELIVDHGRPEAWNDPKALAALDRLLTRMRSYSDVGSAGGLPELLRLSQGKPEGRLPKTRAAVAESWFLLSMGENSPLKHFLTADGSSARLMLRLRDVPSDRSAKTIDRLVGEARAAFPTAKVTVAGMGNTVHKLNNGVSRELLIGFWEALGVITLILAFVFRSWRWTFMAVLPNLIPAAVLIGVLALAKTPIKPSVALVFSIALGIAFNNTVYLLQRLRAIMKETGRDAHEEILATLRLEGNPCLVATLCLMAGFGIFLFSEFGINQTFGIYMLISLFFGLVGDLVFLPALIVVCPWILGSTPRNPVANLVLEESMSEEKPGRAAAAVAALAMLLGFGSTASAALDAISIMKKVEQGLVSKDETAVIKMKVVESNGSSKEREMEIKRKSGTKHQVLVRLKSPKDVSGIAVLAVSNGKSEDQWIYMPSQHKARRVVGGGNKSQKILDTEFSVEDFSVGTYARFTNTIAKEERSPSAAVAVIESRNKVSGDATYSKILTWVDVNNYQIQKSEYYDQAGKLLKTMVFRDYKKFGTAWRAQTIEVRNMQTSRSTVLRVASLKVNTGLADREFTSSALEAD